MSIKLIQKERQEFVPQGIKNHKTITLKCSNCDKPLMDIMVIKPDAKNPDGSPQEWRVQAKCCYCDGDERSYIEDVTGKFVPGAYGRPNPDDEDDYFLETTLGKCEILDDRVLFYPNKVVKS